MCIGLFNRAIAESGTALCPWAVQENPLAYAILLGEALNCTDTEDTYALINCLRQQDGNEITLKELDIMVSIL